MKVLWIIALRWKHQLTSSFCITVMFLIVLTGTRTCRLSVTCCKPLVSSIDDDHFQNVNISLRVLDSTSTFEIISGPSHIKTSVVRLTVKIGEDVWLSPSFSSSSSIRRTSTRWLMQEEFIESLADSRVQIHRPCWAVWPPLGRIYSLKYPVTLVYIGCICRTVQCKAA